MANFAVSVARFQRHRVEHHSEMQMRTTLFPCVRVMAHYAHVGFTTKESGVCSAFMHAPRARIARNEEWRGPSRSRVSQKEPSARTLAFRLSTIPDDLCARTATPISHTHIRVSRWSDSSWSTDICNSRFMKNVIMKLALTCMRRIMYGDDEHLNVLMADQNNLWLYL